jgi:hypothetical protein
MAPQNTKIWSRSHSSGAKPTRRRKNKKKRGEEEEGGGGEGLRKMHKFENASHFLSEKVLYAFKKVNIGSKTFLFLSPKDP